MDETAMTSPDPVLIKVIAIMVTMRMPPTLPSRCSVINGVTRPANNYIVFLHCIII